MKPSIFCLLLLNVLWMTTTEASPIGSPPNPSPRYLHTAGLHPASFQQASNLLKLAKKNEAEAEGIIVSLDELDDNNRDGDIAFTVEMARTRYENSVKRLAHSKRRRNKRKLVNLNYYSNVAKWTSPVLYKVDTSKFNLTQEHMIDESFRHWGLLACLNFSKRGWNEDLSSTPHLVVTQDSGCYSYLGQQMVEQQISLEDWCVEWIGYPSHEIGHALGLTHEHQRPDRDSHVVVNNNYSPNNAGSFTIPSYSQYMHDKINFDSGSVMMYAARAGTNDGERVIETLDPMKQQTLGQPTFASFYDVMAINWAYCLTTDGSGCNGNTVACENGGYPDPLFSCNQCRCSDGFTGSTCTDCAPSSAECVGTGVVTVTDDVNWNCVESPNYGLGSYPFGTVCNWHLQSLNPAEEIEVKFVGNYGTVCKDVTETCIHWWEIKQGSYGHRGARFCCDMTPSYTIRGTGKVVAIFNAEYDYHIPASRIPSSDYKRGGQLCYKLVVSIDPCDSIPCQYAGTCSASGGSYSCTCATGYSGVNCEVTPCSSTPCQNNGICTPVGPSYTCSCTSGYSGTNCDVTPCTSGPCKNGGTCSHNSGTYTCTCASGYTGTDCTVVETPCTSQPCQNGGTCTHDTVTHTCTCPSDTSGTNCEILITPCTSQPCVNGGTCTHDTVTYTCTCPAGYTGTNCEVVVTPCTNQPCQNGGTCTHDTVTYTCMCPSTYTGTNCEVLITPCTSQPCQNGGVCSHDSVSYTCTCQAGYTGIDCEVSLGPCSSAPCDNAATCVESGNTYSCQCLFGYTGLTCSEIDECASNPCQNGGQCTDGNLSYTCNCIKPWKGTNCERKKGKRN